MPGRGLPLGVQGDKFTGDLPNGLARLGLRIRPVAATQLAQRRLLAADVTGQLIQGVHRDEQLVGRLPPLVGGVLQNQVLPASPAYGALHHLRETADSVLVVNHQITRGQCQRIDGVAPPRRQPLALRTRGPVAGQVGFGDHHQVGTGQDDPVVQRALEHTDHAGGGRLPRLQHRRRGVVFGELLDDPVGNAHARRDHAGHTSGQHVGAQHRENLLDVALLPACRGSGARVQFEGRRGRGGQLANRPPRVPGHGGRGPNLLKFAETRPAELFGVDGRLAADGRHRPGGLQELPAGLDQVCRTRSDLLRFTHQHRSPRRQVIGEQAESLGAQYRGQRLHPIHRYAFGQLDQHVGHTAGHGVLVAGRTLGQYLCAGTHFVGQQQFPTGDRDHHVDVQLGDGTLIGDREHPHLGDLVAPELNPDRMLGGRREKVEDAPAHRELTAPRDHVDPVVGEFDQPGRQAIEVELGADRQHDWLDIGQIGGHRLQQRSHRGDDDLQRRPQPVVIRARQPPQQHHPGTDGVRPRREPFMRKGLPGREHRRGLTEHPAQFGGEVVGLPSGRRHHQQRAPARQGSRDEQLRADRAHHVQHVGMLGGPLGEFGERRRGEHGVGQTGQRGLHVLTPRCGHGAHILGSRQKPLRRDVIRVTTTPPVTAGRPRGWSSRSTSC